MVVMVAVTALVASIPWMLKSNRFGMRTLLIATTLGAIVLGLIASASR